MTTQTNVKHTPGPWIDNTYQINQGGEVIESGYTIYGENRVVARIPLTGEMFPADRDVQLANKNLMRVAPEMLEMLKKMQLLCAVTGCAAEEEAVEALIARAEGGSR